MRYAYKLYLIFNALLFCIIGLRYLSYAPQTYDFGNLSFLVLSLIGHMSLLGFSLGVIISPALLIKNSKIKKVIIALLAASASYFLCIDTVVFSFYRFHVDPVLSKLLLSKQVYSFSVGTWVISVGLFALLFALQYFVLALLERYWASLKKTQLVFKPFVSLLILCLVVVNIQNCFAVAKGNQVYGSIRRVFPLYYPMRANKLMLKLGIVDKETIERSSKFESKQEGNLNYPLADLEFREGTERKNIVVIAIDAWRYDTFSKESSPHIWQFAKKNQAVSFKKHMSTGNCTRTGIFGLFYGIPGTYWDAFLSTQTEPVLLERLRLLNYKIQAFPSAPLVNPEFHRTVFAGCPDINTSTEGKGVCDRDIQLTDNWISWIENQTEDKPFLSFLFYDAPHAGSYPLGYPNVFESSASSINHMLLNKNTDPVPLLNHYRTCVHFVDSQVKRVIDTLEKKNLLNNTIVIITGDHAEEFNDNQQNYWGHNGNFSRHQVQVPFIWFQAGDVKKLKENASGHIMTSHEDIAPTLMTELLGCESDLKAYTTGQNLFNKMSRRDWLIASAYAEYALIEEDSILHVSRYGTCEYTDSDLNALSSSMINYDYFDQALEMMRTFYK